MDKDRIAALIEGIKQWNNVYEPPIPPTMGIFHDRDGNERIIAWTNPDCGQQLFDSLQGIDSNSKISSPVALSDYIMNEGDE